MRGSPVPAGYGLTALLLAALATPLLAGCATQPPARAYDCSEKLENDRGVFATDGRFSNWSNFVSSGPAAGVGTHIGYSRMEGIAGEPWFVFGPPTNLWRKSLWLEVRVDGASLPLSHLASFKGESTVGIVSADSLMPLLKVGAVLTVSFVDDRGGLLDRVSIPTARVLQAVAELNEMHRRGVERSSKPAERCKLEEPEIVVTFLAPQAVPRL